MMNKILSLILIILFTNQFSFAMDDQGLLSKAWEEYYNGNFKRALVLVNNMVGQARNNAEVFTLRAQVKTELNDIKGAMADINRAIKISPSVERYLLRAYLYARTNDETKISNILDDVFNVSDKNEKRRNFQIRYYCVIKILDDPNITDSMKYQIYNVMLKAYEVVCKKTKSLPMVMNNYYTFLIKYTNFMYSTNTENLLTPDKKPYNLSKLYALNQIKTMIKESVEAKEFGATSSEKQVLEQTLFGLYDCATGNRQKGLDSINKAKKKAKNIKTVYDGREFASILEDMVEFSLAEVESKTETDKKVN